ncbi:MAG TPA: NrtA/SsuA/CpmA family ABC transporter substrate-binding protein [Polyangiaceae bacterium]|nr:NrtA/SsuA/CpmA family ABC transporter substrate-binding protein [Polyangiaceae bacterium]
MLQLRSWILFTLALSGSACTEAQSKDSAPAKKDEQGAPVQQPVTTIRLADEGNAGLLAYAKREGVLERELAKVGAKIEWVPAAGAFSANFEAMNSGTINTSRAAVSPIVGALAHNLRFKVFAVAERGTGIQSGVISPKGSSIRRVEDLVGKRVALNLAAHGDYVLLRSLQKFGIPADKVQRVPIQPPDAAAAFATGKVDAWSTFGVFLTTAVNNGANVLVSEDQIESDDVGVISANVETLKSNPLAYRTLLKVLADLTELAHREPEKFQNVFTDKGPTAASGAVLQANIEETRKAPSFHVPASVDKERIANVAKLLFENDSIDRDIRVDEIVFDIDAAATAAASATGVR